MTVFLKIVFSCLLFISFHIPPGMQIMERILLSSKKTRLHEGVLQIIFLHLDPVLPLPRVRMLSVTSLALAHFPFCYSV